jgi:hypothetical protein
MIVTASRPEENDEDQCAIEQSASGLLVDHDISHVHASSRPPGENRQHPPEYVGGGAAYL